MKVTAAASRELPLDEHALLERDEAILVVRRAVAAGQNLLVHGVAGVGKSTLLRSALRGQQRRPLFCSATAAADLYREALARLAESGNSAAVARLRRVAPLSSVSCRGVVEDILGAGAYCLVLDPAPMASRLMANSLRDLLRFCDTPLLCASESPHMEAIGYLAIFFALQSEKLRVAPLSEAGARQFAEAELARIGADFDEPERVVQQILHWAKGSPGWIRAMLEMTRQPRYRWQNQIKVHLIYLDLLTGTRMRQRP